MSDLSYLIGKFESASIVEEPFPHLYIEDFLDSADFAEVVKSADITLPEARDTNDLFTILDAASYQAIEFPGCTKSRTEYIAWLESAVKPQGTHEACEGKGMALRCMTPRSEAVRAVDAFFQTPALREVLSRKFGITAPTTLDCGLQKYLNGYEISPHPDIRRKALTWMLNVNPGVNTEAEDYHTHYMKLKPEWEFIGKYWETTPDAETCWIPWDWCDTQKRQRPNNSTVVFSPRHDTLHAVRAHYNHLSAQRTQFYGNLWYRPVDLPIEPRFHDFAGGSAPSLSRSRKAVFSSAAKRMKSRFVDWAPTR